jgi:type VI protein secretion system component Hcp
VITREVDSSSPALFHCFVTAEGFTTAVIELPKPGSAGHSTKGDTIELTNGFITAVSHATSKGGKRRESLTLVFEDIKVNGAPGAPKGGVEHYWWRDTW